LCLCLAIGLSPRRNLFSLEVMTRTGRRRRFSNDDKARMVEETLAPGAVVGLSPSNWLAGAASAAVGGGCALRAKGRRVIGPTPLPWWPPSPWTFAKAPKAWLR
jgi:hypothetical protein